MQMTNKLGLSTGLATSVLLMAACSGVSVDDIETSTNELDSTFQEVIDSNNQLHQLEENMNEQFDEVLAQDEELASLQDDSADVIQNIDERASIVEDSNAQVDKISEQAEAIGQYEGEELPADTLQQISDDFMTFSDQLADHYARYQDSLDVQRDYLNQTAADDANYEDFANGLETVNEDYIALQEATAELDQQLVKYEDQLVTLNELVADTRDEETETAENTEEEAAEDETEANADENAEEGLEDSTVHLTVTTDSLLNVPDKFPRKFVYDDGVDIEYPEDGVKGIYATAHSAGGDRMSDLTELLNSTDLNTMVVDIKDDHGNITVDLDSDNELINEATNEMIDVEELMNTMEENDIYPIARIVVFKDTLLANEKPDWSFTNNDGSVWSNGGGDSFVNPYMKEVWDYNTQVAIEAAKLGFKEIQFDYVRFPEGFETRDRELNYGHGHYGSDDVDVINMEHRNQAVTDFVGYAREQLQPYGTDVSVDIFGYAAVVGETPGIGQSFPGIASEVDVISSMIYPSHWGPGNLDIARPDLEPYNVVDNYMEIELEVLDELGEDAPTTRPWLQDFTASYLGAGNYREYGAQEVTDQIRALADHGVHEFLLWNAGNTYSEGATYTIE